MKYFIAFLFHFALTMQTQSEIKKIKMKNLLLQLALYRALKLIFKRRMTYHWSK